MNVKNVQKGTEMVAGIVKFVVGITASMGAGKVVGTAVKQFSPADVSKIERLLTAVGGIAICGIVGGAAAHWTSELIDDVTSTISKMKAVLKNRKEKKSN